MSAAPGLAEFVAAALAEDVGSGDRTTEAVVPEAARATARIVQKEPGVIYGLDAAAEAFQQSGAGQLERLAPEGEWRAEVPAPVAAISGAARGVLTGERVALNLLGRLSGVATLTARFVEAARAEGGRAIVLDTRKTTPGLRALEKAAVIAGGGSNHRLGLFDAILIKENHVAVAGGIEAAVRRAREAEPELPVEVEVRDATELDAALAAGADRILLDNMGPEELREAVAARDRVAAGEERVPLEASGGVTLETIGAVSASGVDYVSVGALTHSAPALDLSLLVEIR